MERFTPKFRGRDWVDGSEVTHAYLLPRTGVDDELIALAHACRRALSAYPVDPACPPEAGDPGTLHVTIEMVADAPTADISAGELADLVSALREELADITPFVAELGPPTGTQAGAVLDVRPQEPAVALRERVRGAIRRTRGDAALRHNGGRIHCSLGYGYGAADSDRLDKVLRSLTPSRARLHVDSLHLLNVRFGIAEDTGGWRLSWQPIAEIPLGG